MLVDTSVLIRTLPPHHPLYSSADRAIRLLPEQGGKLHIVAQNLIELWVVATRPPGENGLGMITVEAAAEIQWEALVTLPRIPGKPSHDARLVAAMKVHGLTAILTFDRAGFSRFAGIVVLQ